MKPTINPFQQSFGRLFQQENRGEFWVAQVVGWAGLSVISYFSLNLWYNQPEWTYLGHNLLQSLLGIILSTPLRTVYRWVWNYPFTPRFIAISLAVLLFSTAWAALRLLLFERMTGESGLWSDFGGWLFSSIFIFLCWTALYHVFKYYRLSEQEHTALLRMESQRNSAGVKAARAESSAREAQLTMLRYQLNPHFLFNTLNAIQSLVTSRQTDRATEMIACLSDFLRYSLYTDGKKLVTVEQELETIGLYLQIEQARFQDRLTVTYDIDPQVKEARMPSMLLQPLVENAIKYAIAPAEDGGTIGISARRVQESLMLAVTDSGQSHAGVSTADGTGVGLQNIKQRLENSYADNFSLQLLPCESGGMRAEIRLPLFADIAAA
ncbi:MAG: sensor histidine kinase [Congregibacter sp.]